MSSGAKDVANSDERAQALGAEIQPFQHALIECRERLEQMEGLFAHVADAVFLARTDGRIVDVNPAACAMLGYSRGELLAFHQWDIVTSASRDEILKLWQSMMPGAPVTVQRTCRTRNGHPIEVELRLARCSLGGRDLIIVTCRDVTEQTRAKAMLAGETRLLEMIAKGEPLTPILEALCRMGEEMSPETLVSILLVSSDGKSLRHGAAPSLPATYTAAIDGALIGPQAGSCGTAAYRGEPVNVADIATDSLWAKYRDLALGQGLRSCWSTPIFSTTRQVIGTFALYSRKPGQPTPQQQAITEQFAHLASIAIERTRAQEALRRGDAYLTEAQRLSRTGSFGWRVASGELIWSAETFCIMGYDKSVKPSLSLVFKRVHPDDITLVQQMIDRATRDGTDLDFEHRLLMPDGLVKHVHIVARATKTDSDPIEFVGAVMDITERKRAAEARQAAVMDERNRMARDIHDTLAQGFTGVIMQMEAAKGAAERNDLAEVIGRIDRAGELARSSLAEARRSVRALRLPSLQAGKLSLAIDDLLKRMAEGSALQAEFHADGEERLLASDCEETLLRITQEALTNTIKHAQARNFRATLAIRERETQLQLVDDGRGFDPLGEHEGFGLTGMKERVDRMGGEFIVRSKPGEGTEIVVTWRNPNGNEQA